MSRIPRTKSTPTSGGAIRPAEQAEGSELSEKGLQSGSVGLLGAIVVGISCIAPAYTLTAALGPTVAAVGTKLPAIFLVGFVPMLLVALGYRELNKVMPDAGTSFTWSTRAFGPWIGWMAGWGLVAATVIVLSNLAAVAVDFFYILLAQIFNNPGLASLAQDKLVNIGTTLVFIAVACWISYRGMSASKALQYGLVAFQLVVLIWFTIAALWHGFQGSAFHFTPIQLEWFNPFDLGSFSAFAAGLSLSIFIFWGWDTTLTINEETSEPDKVPGRATMWTVVIIVALYIFVALAVLNFSGVGTTGLGAGNPDNQLNIFAALAPAVMGPFAILMALAVLSSSAASLQSTFISPSRTLLAMGHYRAVAPSLGNVSERHLSPSRATVLSGVAAGGFYAITRLLSESALWDTIAALGMMICFYYGITALACVWYFRGELFTSVRSVIVKFLAPLIGGLALIGMFFKTMWDAIDPSYGSGSSLGGVGMVFIIGMSVLVLGVLIMFYVRWRRPEFFRGQILGRTSSTAVSS